MWGGDSTALSIGGGRGGGGREARGKGIRGHQVSGQAGMSGCFCQGKFLASLSLLFPAGTSPARGRSDCLLSRKRKSPDGGRERHSGSQSGPRRVRRRLSGHRRGPESRRARVSKPPPLRETLVSTLRSLSEATYENLLQLSRESPAPRALLSQLRAPLWTLTYSCYALASQAAYAMPVEGWLLPAARSPLPTQGGTEEGGQRPAQKRAERK